MTEFMVLAIVIGWVWVASILGDVIKDAIVEASESRRDELLMDELRSLVRKLTVDVGERDEKVSALSDANKALERELGRFRETHLTWLMEITANADDRGNELHVAVNSLATTVKELLAIADAEAISSEGHDRLLVGLDDVEFRLRHLAEAIDKTAEKVDTPKDELDRMLDDGHGSAIGAPIVEDVMEEDGKGGFQRVTKRVG